MSGGLRVALVGATGAVGTTMLDVMNGRGLPVSEVVPYASERSAGKTLQFGSESLEVRVLGAEPVSGFDVALFSAGGTISKEWAPRFAAEGCVVVDNSSAWRMEPNVPLVVAEVNPDAIDRHEGIVANPNCSTMQMVMALKPIHDEARIERVVVSTYQSTSGTGQRAIDELRDQAHAMLHGMEHPPSVYPHQIAFNVLPQVETFKDGDDYTTEERKMMAETRKILGDDSLAISATCVRVPVYSAHSESVNVQTEQDLSPERCREVLAGFPGRDRRRRSGRRALPDAGRRRRPRRRARRPHPSRPLTRALPEHVGGLGQPAQGRCDERRAACGAAPGARPRRFPRSRRALSPALEVRKEAGLGFVSAGSGRENEVDRSAAAALESPVVDESRRPLVNGSGTGDRDHLAEPSPVDVGANRSRRRRGLEAAEQLPGGAVPQ